MTDPGAQSQTGGRSAEFGQGVSPDGSAQVSNLNEVPGPNSVHSVPELQQTLRLGQPFDRYQAGVDAMSQNIKSTSGLSSGDDPGGYTRFAGGGPFVQNDNGMSPSTHQQSLMSLKPVDPG